MSTERNGPFKRINFFRGFSTTEQDWNDGEAYHLEKRKLHNRTSHAPGVVLGHGGELRVLARARGDLSFEVQPGYAIDGEGRDLVLWETVIKTIVAEEYKLPTRLYVVLRYVEELTDFIAYKENLEYKGHRRVTESARVEIVQARLGSDERRLEEPDIRQEVELARIELDKGATRIRDARNPNDPLKNEIDLRFVPHAGVAGSFLPPPVRQRVTTVLAAARKSFLRMAREGKVLTAHDALAATTSASMLHACEVLDLRNVFDAVALIVEMEQECATEIEVAHPALSAKKDFADYRKHLEALKAVLGERRATLDALQNLAAYQLKVAESVQALFGGAVLEPAAVEAAPSAPRKEAPRIDGLPAYEDWDQVKTISKEDLPEQLAIAGTPWAMVDRINVKDADSESSHALQIIDAKDAYGQRQKQRYPDGTVLEDAGRAHVGGYCQFTVKNLIPGKDLAVVRRIDYVYGDYELEFIVDGKSAGVSSNTGTDRVNRWRNWPYVIPGEFVTRSSVTIKQIALTAGRDINMFRYWFFQPK
jgi:hypothetical protein